MCQAFSDTVWGGLSRKGLALSTERAAGSIQRRVNRCPAIVVHKLTQVGSGHIKEHLQAAQ